MVQVERIKQGGASGYGANQDVEGRANPKEESYEQPYHISAYYHKIQSKIVIRDSQNPRITPSPGSYGQQ